MKKHDKNQPNSLFGSITYGADNHLFELNPVISQAEIAKFETKHRVTLPEDYKFFITKIGNGGAGPGNGLLPIEKWSYGLRDVESDFLSIPFFNGVEKNWRMSSKLDDPYFSNKYVSGSIRISDYGCGIHYMLVITGNEKGNIWVDDRANIDGIYKVYHEDDEDNTKPETFESWYTTWLNTSISDFEIESKPPIQYSV